MRNRRTKRALRGTDGVNVDPLVIARGIGEQIDLLLGDGGPVGDGDLLACAGTQFGVRVEGFHAFNLGSLGAAVSRHSDRG